MEQLVDLEELIERLPFIEGDPEAEAEGNGALMNLSDDARFYGSDDWVEPDSTPYQVRRLILRAAVTHMKNPDGFTQSRAGDEAVSWADGDVSSDAEFTDEQKRRLRQYAGFREGGGFYSVGTFAYGRSGRAGPSVGYVPVAGGGDLFPYFADTSGPW